MQTTPKEQLLTKIRRAAALLARYRPGLQRPADLAPVELWLGAQPREFYAGYEAALRAVAHGIARRIA